MILTTTTPQLQSLLERYASTPMPLTRTGLSAVDLTPLGELTAHSLFPAARDPQAALSGLLLRLGHWEQSHGVAQDISSQDGSYWHAIAHRLEPDDFNAGYWYRRVGMHPTYSQLQGRAAALLRATPVSGWAVSGSWDPIVFVEWCREARSVASQHPQDPRVTVARALGQAEWELLFSWCALSPA